MTNNDKELPTSPGQMGFLEYRKQCEFIRNAFYELASMASDVEITFEPTDDECGCDDSDGEWRVYARHGGKTFEVKHERIENALWYVLTHMTAKDRTDFENRERKRKAALAKLTDEERQILHVS